MLATDRQKDKHCHHLEAYVKRGFNKSMKVTDGGKCRQLPQCDVAFKHLSFNHLCNVTVCLTTSSNATQ